MTGPADDVMRRARVAVREAHLLYRFHMTWAHHFAPPGSLLAADRAEVAKLYRAQAYTLAWVVCGW